MNTIIWDWNGTLWDDVNQWFLAAKAAYAHAEIPQNLTIEALRDAFDVPISEVIYRLGASRDLPQSAHDALLETFRNTLAVHESKAHVKEGSYEVLEALTASNFEHHIASNHPVNLLEKELEKSGLTQFFTHLSGNNHHDEVYKKASKMQKVQDILGSQACDLETVYIVADTREEIRIAHELGLISIALTGGYNSEKMLLQEKPHHLAHSMRDVKKLIIG
jgi:phosphoglycolate phosphatase